MTSAFSYPVLLAVKINVFLCLLTVSLIVVLPFLKKDSIHVHLKTRIESSIILICRVQVIFLQQYFLWQSVKGLFLKHMKQRLKVLLLLVFNQFYFIQAVKVCLIPKSPTIEISEKRRLPRQFSGKESSCQCRRYRDVGLILRWGRSPGIRNGNPLLYSCLENSMGRGAQQATVHVVTKSQTLLSHAHTGKNFLFLYLVISGIKIQSLH